MRYCDTLDCRVHIYVCNLTVMTCPACGNAGVPVVVS